MTAQQTLYPSPSTCPALREAALSFPGGSERRSSRLGAHNLNGPAVGAGSASG